MQRNGVNLLRNNRAIDFTQLQAMDCATRTTKVYEALCVQHHEVSWNTLVWSMFHIPKTSFISWLTCHGRLATKDHVARYRDIAYPLCVLCRVVVETQQHLFFQCEYARVVLQKTLLSVGLWWINKGWNGGLIVSAMLEGRGARFFR